jgi:hypothetical protein
MLIALTVAVAPALVTPLAVAVICAVPVATAVASPVVLPMDITFGALLAHVKDVPGRVTPLPVAVAENCSVLFTAMNAGDGATAMLVMAVTVTAPGALVTPLAAAVICAVPIATAVASPVLLLIDITLGALLAHVKVRLLIVFPLLSTAVAENCCVPFTAIDNSVGVTEMDEIPELPECLHPVTKTQRAKRRSEAAL